MADKAYARLAREDWDKLGPTALARELFNMLNTAAPTSGAGDSTSSGSGSGGTQQVFEGTVISGGPGSSYQVRLDTGVTVTATQMMIDAAETIPANTITPVFLLTDGTYRINVPTWGL